MSSGNISSQSPQAVAINLLQQAIISETPDIFKDFTTVCYRHYFPHSCPKHLSFSEIQTNFANLANVPILLPILTNKIKNPLNV